jgi:hypothetical protein
MLNTVAVRRVTSRKPYRLGPAYLGSRLIRTVGLTAYHPYHVNMTSSDLKSTAAKGTQLIRVLLLTNFALLLTLIGPGNNRQLYLAEKRMGIAHIVTHSLQLWFIGSTAVVAVLFPNAGFEAKSAPIIESHNVGLGAVFGLVVCGCAFLHVCVHDGDGRLRASEI